MRKIIQIIVFLTLELGAVYPRSASCREQPRLQLFHELCCPFNYKSVSLVPTDDRSCLDGAGEVGPASAGFLCLCVRGGGISRPTQTQIFMNNALTAS